MRGEDGICARRGCSFPSPFIRFNLCVPEYCRPGACSSRLSLPDGWGLRISHVSLYLPKVSSLCDLGAGCLQRETTTLWPPTRTPLLQRARSSARQDLSSSTPSKPFSSCPAKGGHACRHEHQQPPSERDAALEPQLDRPLCDRRLLRESW